MHKENMYCPFTSVAANSNFIVIGTDCKVGDAIAVEVTDTRKSRAEVVSTIETRPPVLTIRDFNDASNGTCRIAGNTIKISRRRLVGVLSANPSRRTGGGGKTDFVEPTVVIPLISTWSPHPQW